jgi:hypothetical protein
MAAFMYEEDRPGQEYLAWAQTKGKKTNLAELSIEANVPYKMPF